MKRWIECRLQLGCERGPPQSAHDWNETYFSILLRRRGEARSSPAHEQAYYEASGPFGTPGGRRTDGSTTHPNSLSQAGRPAAAGSSRLAAPLGAAVAPLPARVEPVGRVSSPAEDQLS